MCSPGAGTGGQAIALGSRSRTPASRAALRSVVSQRIEVAEPHAENRSFQPGVSGHCYDTPQTWRGCARRGSPSSASCGNGGQRLAWPPGRGWVLPPQAPRAVAPRWPWGSQRVRLAWVLCHPENPHSERVSPPNHVAASKSTVSFPPTTKARTRGAQRGARVPPGVSLQECIPRTPGLGRARPVRPLSIPSRWARPRSGRQRVSRKR